MGCVSASRVQALTQRHPRELGTEVPVGQLDMHFAVGHSRSVAWDQAACKASASCPEDLAYLGWRQRAVAVASPAARIPALSDAQSQALEAEMVELRGRVAEYLGSPQVLNAVLSPEIIGSFMKADADWRPFVHGCLKRVRDVNELGGPRMQVVWWGSLKALGRIPMWPIDEGHILDAERLLDQWTENMDEYGKVSGRGFCVSGFSHRWERPGLDVATAHPDTLDHKKAARLVKYGEQGTCPIFEPNHKFDYYYWVDFAGINQLDIREKHLGVCKLPTFISVTTEVIMYNSSTVDYEPRAWTRAERALGFTFTASPLFVYMDDKYPDEELDLDRIVSDNPRCFAKDADTEALMLIMRDPCGDGACATDPRDMELLCELTSLVQKAVPLNPQRIASGVDKLDFGRARILLDTEHYGIDCEAAMTRMASQQSVLASASRSRSRRFTPDGPVETSSEGAPTNKLEDEGRRRERPRIKMSL